MSWIAVVLNDSSGSGDCSEAAKRLQQIFANAGRETRITLAQNGEELRSAVEAAVKEGCQTLVAGGGDGTVNMAASAVVGREVPLGVIPLGTLNHFAKDLGIPLKLEDAARLILEGPTCRVDVGEVNGRVFLNNSSIGVYPRIVRMRERYQVSGLGKWIAALWATLTVLQRNPFMAVRIVAEGETIVRRTPFVFVGNNEYQMSGFQAGSRHSLVNRTLAVYVVSAERRVGLIGLAWKVLRMGTEKVKELDLITVKDVIVETRRRRLQVALDGEVLTLDSPLSYRSRPASLLVHVPADSAACRPLDLGAAAGTRLD